MEMERLAAFLDGRLEGDERAAVLAHLDRCADCYEVFVDSARFLEEERLEEGPAENEAVIVPIARPVGETRTVQEAQIAAAAARRRQWIAASGLAAAAAMAAFVGMRYWRADPWPAVTAELAAARIGEGEAQRSVVELEGWDAPGWPIYRGNDPTPRGEAEHIAFRCGVLVTELMVAIDANRQDLGSQAARRLGRLTESDATALFLLIGELDQLRLDLEEGVDDPRARADRLEEQLAETLAEPPSLSLAYRHGRWLESGRLASLARASALLRQRRLHRTVATLAEDADETVAERAAILSDLLAQGPPRAADDYLVLREAFELSIKSLAGP